MLSAGGRTFRQLNCLTSLSVATCLLDRHFVVCVCVLSVAFFLFFIKKRKDRVLLP